MRISGKEIAEQMYTTLTERVKNLQRLGITPHLVDILIGDDPSSESYVRQKQRAGEDLGAKVTILQLPTTIATDELTARISELNHEDLVHGIIVQRPLPKHIISKQIDLAIDPMKDIDGFHPHSPFTLPLPLAVVKILHEIYRRIYPHMPFTQWLGSQMIVVLGKGETGGKPITEYLKQLGITPHVIDSLTLNPHEITCVADIVISAVGKPNVITPEIIKPGAILIGVGLHMESDGKVHGDYDRVEIENIAKFYTPTPGGVGPVNVACLMENLVTATENQVAQL